MIIDNPGIVVCGYFFDPGKKYFSMSHLKAIGEIAEGIEGVLSKYTGRLALDEDSSFVDSTIGVASVGGVIYEDDFNFHYNVKGIDLGDGDACVKQMASLVVEAGDCEDLVSDLADYFGGKPKDSVISDVYGHERIFRKLMPKAWSEPMTRKSRV